MAWIGLLGSKAVAGVGVGGMFTWFSQGLAAMARMGGQVQVAQCIGRGEKEKAHGFAQAGGVMGAVKAYLKEEADKINAIQVSDINKKNIALLRACAKTGKAAGQFIEVMACEGGCITGPSTHNDIVSGRRQLVQELLKRKESYETMGR